MLRGHILLVYGGEIDETPILRFMADQPTFLHLPQHGGHGCVGQVVSIELLTDLAHPQRPEPPEDSHNPQLGDPPIDSYSLHSYLGTPCSINYRGNTTEVV